MYYIHTEIHTEGARDNFAMRLKWHCDRTDRTPEDALQGRGKPAVWGPITTRMGLLFKPTHTADRRESLKLLD